MPKVDVITEDHCPFCGSESVGPDMTHIGDDWNCVYLQCLEDGCDTHFTQTYSKTIDEIHVDDEEYLEGDPLLTTGKDSQ